MSLSFIQYDCSSADINPIGSISKQDLRAFLKWAAMHLGFSSLAEIEAAPPTAELEPIRSNYSQVMDFLSHAFFSFFHLPMHYFLLTSVSQRNKLKGWASHYHVFALKSNSLLYKTAGRSGHGNDIRGTLCLWKVAENFPMWSGIYVQGPF